ncbi:MAG TPA: alpha/beta hydrolase [Candidatus Saccharimonadales bacterium]|jgi:pimeloyl-ACP methyl ester carboxylesterase|nr:alpha/beta hydrolase [Candidatus Saccharimonadales bacterium]
MQVVVDSLLTHYETEGKGQLVVLLHGWGDTAAGLKGLQHALAKKYQVLAVDLPGFGGTEAPQSIWGLDDYSKFIAAFLRKIDAGQVRAIAGHSNGGAIAIRGLATGVLQAGRLVLLASAGIRGTYKGRVKVLRYITKAGKALTMPLPKAIKRKLRKQVYKTVGSDMLVAEHLQGTFKKVVTDDVRDNARQLTQPALLIYGENDEATPLWYGETYHELIPVSTLEVLPGAGHFVHIDRPAEVVRAIEGFLA